MSIRTVPARTGRIAEDHTMPLLRAERLTKAVTTPEGPLTILDHIDLAIEEGETLAVLGVSGSGKSTLLGLLAGLDLPTSGEVYFEGEALSKLSEGERASLRLQKVGFLFQLFHLIPTLTALENVMLPLELRRERCRRARAREMLERLDLGHRLHHLPQQLSAGEKQRVALARALITRPKVLFADEPTASLDRRSAQRVVEQLFALRETFGTTLIVVTHDPQLAGRCQRVVELEAGRIVREEPR